MRALPKRAALAGAILTVVSRLVLGQDAGSAAPRVSIEGVDWSLRLTGSEFNLVVEWYPNDWFWLNVLLGYCIPGDALARSGLTNSFATINSGATALGRHDSFDTVVAMGVRF
ncbi:MAG: hypothetical protein HY699_02360 [Deltaproteobacteria bacterium]|nr:hypothetical protein [Deltaproteobacteria bacterium]